MQIRNIAALTGVIVSLATPAFATSITNQDSKEHTVRIDHGAKESERKIAAGDTVQVDCPERCGFTVEGSGYGREPGNDGKLTITKDGVWSFSDR